MLHLCNLCQVEFFQGICVFHINQVKFLAQCCSQYSLIICIPSLSSKVISSYSQLVIYVFFISVFKVYQFYQLSQKSTSSVINFPYDYSTFICLIFIISLLVLILGIFWSDFSSSLMVLDLWDLGCFFLITQSLQATDFILITALN